jgi:hypothetical protein
MFSNKTTTGYNEMKKTGGGRPKLKTVETDKPAEIESEVGPVGASARKRLEWLRLYRRLEEELERPPTRTELGEQYGLRARAAHIKGRSIEQTLMKLRLIDEPKWKLVAKAGGTTALGRSVLKRYPGET